ncbi:hypothetical protein LR48_Vigan04g133100 [Vigna angularis]|uniref:Retrotransposon gag domain-containing protein n=1 Tax=Phaseolus angularis TaxID=3914 RepID=A0A0L9UEG5_PHAAN|nr:hypothetical protein LR48_Vigan04g133100 [Vigna angularis]
MAQDLMAIMQEMQRRMEAMQAEIETLRAERDATRRDRDAGRRGAPTRTPIVEFLDFDQEGTDQGENSSRRSHARPVHVAHARALHPFTTAVMEEQMPERTFPILERYDGSGDPEKHLRSFVDAMAIYSPSERVWCRVFSLSVKGEALE